MRSIAAPRTATQMDVICHGWESLIGRQRGYRLRELRHFGSVNPTAGWVDPQGSCYLRSLDGAKCSEGGGGGGMAMGAIDECKDDGRFRWSVIRVHPPPPRRPRALIVKLRI